MRKHSTPPPQVAPLVNAAPKRIHDNLRILALMVCRRNLFMLVLHVEWLLFRTNSWFNVLLSRG